MPLEWCAQSEVVGILELAVKTIELLAFTDSGDVKNLRHGLPHLGMSTGTIYSLNLQHSHPFSDDY